MLRIQKVRGKADNGLGRSNAVRKVWLESRPRLFMDANVKAEVVKGEES